jgi:hypothetical protein
MEADPTNAVRRKGVGSFFLGWVASLGLFVIVVALGTFLFLLCSITIGYLPYSDRPGPGWGRTHFNWGETHLFLNSVLFMAVFFLPFAGATLFPFAQILGWLVCPRWIVRAVGSLFSGFAAMIAVLALAWYVALSQYPIYAGGVFALVYGAFVLPRFDRFSRSRSRTWKHWLGIVATIVCWAAVVSYPIWRLYLGAT